jgi:tRNA(adenine34) deaminase
MDTTYRAEIGRWISLLQEADESRLVAIRDVLCIKRLQWVEDNAAILVSLKGDDLERAYKLILYKIGIDEQEAPVAFKNERRIVFHSKNQCPMLTACMALGLDTRKICRRVLEIPTDILVKQVNEELRFSRNYNTIRPYSSYCEEVISFP